jgi:hypothetical protein
LQALEPGPLASGWRIDAHQPGQVLKLSLTGDRLSQELKRRVLVLPLPVFFIALLLAWSWNADWGIKLMAWPVAALFAFVFVAGVLSVSRTLKRRRKGVMFNLDKSQGTLRGVLEADFGHSTIDAPLSQLKTLELVVNADATGAWALLKATLADGRRLQAPEARAETADAAREKLKPVKDAADEIL